MKHYLIKQANTYVLYDEFDNPIGDFYLRHGKVKHRDNFDKIINESFEVR